MQYYFILDTNRSSRRAFQDPNLDDFFTPSFTTRDIFTDPPSIFNRFGPDHHLIQPSTKLSSSRISPTSSPKISPNRKAEQEIPISYLKTNTDYPESSDNKDLPFTSYKKTNPSSRVGSRMNTFYFFILFFLFMNLFINKNLLLMIQCVCVYAVSIIK